MGMENYSTWDLQRELQRRKEKDDEEERNKLEDRKIWLLRTGQSLSGNDQCVTNGCRINCTGCDRR